MLSDSVSLESRDIISGNLSDLTNFPLEPLTNLCNFYDISTGAPQCM